MTKLPYMPLYMGDFLASTARWSGEEQALYLILLCYQWATGPLPANPRDLCRMLRYEPKIFNKHWKQVSSKFIEIDQGLINQRLEEHRNKAGAITEKRKTAGKDGAAARWPEKTPDKTPGKTRSERLANARQLGTHSLKEWVALIEACDHRCTRCGTHDSELIGGTLCKDHIVPIYQGGSDAISNIQPMCRNCNSSKGPDDTDHRPLDWNERLAKCLANASQDACNPSQAKEELGVRGLPGKNP